MMKSLSSVPDCPTELPLKAVNTVYFTRLFVKHLVEYYDNKEIWEHMILNLTPDEASQAGLDSSLAITNPAMSTPGQGPVPPGKNADHEPRTPPMALDIR